MSVLTASARTTGMSGRVKVATQGARAQRSAQMPTGVAATSTLAPVWWAPVERRRAAPTRKLEYGPGFGGRVRLRRGGGGGWRDGRDGRDGGREWGVRLD